MVSAFGHLHRYRQLALAPASVADVLCGTDSSFSRETEEQKAALGSQPVSSPSSAIDQLPDYELVVSPLRTSCFPIYKVG